MKSKALKPSLWKKTTTILKNMNWKTLIPKLALVALALSAPAALSQEEILIITGKRMDKTVSYQISPNARELDFSDNRLTSLTLPAGLTNLEELDLSSNQLTSFTLPEGLTSLEYLTLATNQLTSFTLPEGLTSLEYLDLDNNRLTSLTLPEGLTSLEYLTLATNQLTSLNLPENLSVWRWLDISDNQLTSITLPAGLSSLVLDLSGNQLTSLTLPESLTDSWELDLSGNQLASLTLSEGLTSLGSLDLENNRLTSLTLPAGLRLRELDLSGNPSALVIYPDDHKLLSVTGTRANGTLFHWKVSPNSKSLYLSQERLSSITLPTGLSSLERLDVRNTPIQLLLVPKGMNIDNLELRGFSKENIIRYVPDSVFLGLVIRREEDGRVAIIFSGGVLQAAERLSSGDWEDITNAVNPFYINPAEASQKFFRVRSAR